MKKALLLTFLLMNTAYAQRVLVVGDSHTVGPFGQTLHTELSTHYEQVTTVAHSSSAAFHWMSSGQYKLSGGVFHKLTLNGKTYHHPNPTHWREKVLVPKLSDVLSNNALHSEWGQNLNADLVVIALGANDARTIADMNGNINRFAYNQRAQSITEMLKIVRVNNLKCVWIGPPDGMKITTANQNTLYAFLEEQVISKCAFMNSNHYRSEGCDGIHFSCASQRPKAINWAYEARDFILQNE